MSRKQADRKILAKIDGYEIGENSAGGFTLWDDSSKRASYYPDLGCVLSDMLERKVVRLAAADERKNLESLSEAIGKADKWVREIGKTLTKYQDSAMHRGGTKAD